MGCVVSHDVDDGGDLKGLSSGVGPCACEAPLKIHRATLSLVDWRSGKRNDFVPFL